MIGLVQDSRYLRIHFFLQISCYVGYITRNDAYAKYGPNEVLGGMKCTIIALFGISLLTAEESPPLVITPNIPEPVNPERS